MRRLQGLSLRGAGRGQGCEEAAGEGPAWEGPCDEAAGAEPAWEGPCEEAAVGGGMQGGCRGGACVGEAMQGGCRGGACVGGAIYEEGCRGGACMGGAMQGGCRGGTGVEEGPPARPQVLGTGGGQAPNVAGWVEGAAVPARKDCWEIQSTVTDWPDGGRGCRGVGRCGGRSRDGFFRSLSCPPTTNSAVCIWTLPGRPRWPAERGEAGHPDEHADAPRLATAGPTRAGRAFSIGPTTRPSWQCPNAYGGVRRWRT